MSLLMLDKLAPPLISFISTEQGDLRLESVQGGTTIRVEFSNGATAFITDPDRTQRALRLLDTIERPDLYARNAAQKPSPKSTRVEPNTTRSLDEARKRRDAERREAAYEALFGSRNHL